MTKMHLLAGRIGRHHVPDLYFLAADYHSVNKQFYWYCQLNFEDR